MVMEIHFFRDKKVASSSPALIRDLNNQMKNYACALNHLLVQFPKQVASGERFCFYFSQNT